MMNDRLQRRNKYCFGLGTIGRDMFYSTVSMFFMVYLTEALILSDAALLAMTALLTVLRVFDAFNDPFMGVIVDNTRGFWGKFKPNIALGGIAGGFFLVLLFTDTGLSGLPHLVFFAVCYLGWDVFFGLNDIAYWSMLPALSTDQKRREELGAFARICANIGLFSLVVGIIPATSALGTLLGSPRRGWFAFAIIVTALMLAFQCFTLFGVKEQENYFKEEEKTPLAELFRVIFRNDQLLWIALALVLFMTGYLITTGFGVHFFKYIYGDQSMYSVFALVLGLSQLGSLAMFPALAKKMNRRKFYTTATIIVSAGYIVFFLSPMNMLFLGAGGVLIFVGQAFIQTLMLMFLTDTVEYGQWKMGKRNESITFSVQPFIYKLSGALSQGALGVTLVLSGVNRAGEAADVSPSGALVFKMAMLLLPMLLIALGFVIYRFRFKIDEAFHARIVAEIEERGDMGPGAR
jgi:melibiose permease/lactose/raffinose/galactose permease